MNPSVLSSKKYVKILIDRKLNLNLQQKEKEITNLRNYSRNSIK